MRRVINNWKSPLGVILAITHAIMLSWLILSQEPTPLPIPPSPNEVPCSQNAGCFDFRSLHRNVIILADRSFHPGHESLIFRFIYLTDFPAILAAGAITDWILTPLNLSELQLSYLFAMFWVIFGSIEWWIIGIIITNIIREKEKSVISIE